MRTRKKLDAVFNMRLSARELAALHRLSRQRNVTAAALVREWIGQHTKSATSTATGEVR